MHYRYTQLQAKAIIVPKLGCSQCWLMFMLIIISKRFQRHGHLTHFHKCSAHLHVIAVGGIQRGGSARASLGQLCSTNKLQQAETLSIGDAKLLPVLALQHKQLRVSASAKGPSKAVFEQSAMVCLTDCSSGSYQSSHGFLRAVKLYKRHAARPAISMHHKVDAIWAHPISRKKPAAAQQVNQQVAIRDSAGFGSGF